MTGVYPWSGMPTSSGIRVQTPIICLLVLSVQLLPPLPFYFGLASSMALGMVIAGTICVMSLMVCWAIQARWSREGLMDAGAGGLVLIATVVVLIALHGVVADQIQRLDSGRFVASLIPLVLLLGGGLALSAVIRAAQPSQIVTVGWVSFWVMCAVIALRLLHLQPHMNDKSAFPFGETSHFALALGPILLYRCASTRSSRRTLWVIVVFGLAIVLKSATLLATAFLAAVICRRMLAVCALALVVAGAGLSANLKYFTSRAQISDTSSNLSALVYLEGWEMLGRSLIESDGWGVGFQQLGVHGTDATAAEAIEHLTGGGDLNLSDGSFVLSKLGSEFGVGGLLLVAAFCALAARSLLALRSGRGTPGVIFARSIVVAYGVDMFVRGTGYFTESTLLFVGAVLVLAPARGLLRNGRNMAGHALMVLR